MNPTDIKKQSEQSQRNMEIATIIRKQLGGNKFSAMTGAKNFIAICNGLQFRIPYPKINLIEIKLNNKDLYDITFMKCIFSKGKITSTHTVEGIYHDKLCTVFEEHTGLRTSL